MKPAKSKHLNTFSIDVDSETDGKRYQGSFTSKKLSISDLAALGVRKAQLNGGMYWSQNNPGKGVDEGTDDLNNTLAHLEVALVQTPPWWNLEEITDPEVVGAVYKEVIIFENSFHRRAEPTTTDSDDDGRGGGGDREEAQVQSDHDGEPREVVGAEVQSALEP